MKNRWSLVLSGQPTLVEEGVGKGGKESRSHRRRGAQRGLGCGSLGRVFKSLFFLKKEKPPSCVIIFMGSAILAKICL